jgi:hypothetical protein
VLSVTESPETIPIEEPQRFTIRALDYWDQTQLLRRQLPKRIRTAYTFHVRLWQNELWVQVNRKGQAAWETPVACATMVDKPKKYCNTMYDWATLDEELISYLCLAA